MELLFIYDETMKHFFRLPIVEFKKFFSTGLKFFFANDDTVFDTGSLLDVKAAACVDGTPDRLWVGVPISIRVMGRVQTAPIAMTSAVRHVHRRRSVYAVCPSLIMYRAARGNSRLRRTRKTLSRRNVR